MSGFVASVPFETEFEGDAVSMNLTCLKRKDMQLLAPYIHQTDEGDIKMSFEDQLSFLNVFGDLLPKYISNFVGPKDAAGNPLSLESVLEHVYFMDLLSSIVKRLMEVSGVNKGGDEAKK